MQSVKQSRRQVVIYNAHIGRRFGVEGRSDIIFQVVSPLVWEKINFHKEKHGVSFAVGECNIYTNF